MFSVLYGKVWHCVVRCGKEIINKMEQKKDEEDGLLNCIRIINKNPDKLTKEGKIDLAYDIIDELPVEEIDKFLIKWGYKR